MMTIPSTRICDSYAIAVTWHAYVTGLGYHADLRRWGNKWRVTAIGEPRRQHIANFS